jgi:hypothetical protein
VAPYYDQSASAVVRDAIKYRATDSRSGGLSI